MLYYYTASLIHIPIVDQHPLTQFLPHTIVTVHSGDSTELRNVEHKAQER